MKQNNLDRIARALHDMLSSYRVHCGQPPYDAWNCLPITTADLYYTVIEKIDDNIKNNIETTDADVHNYWMEWAMQHKEDHHCIIPFYELSIDEKSKDGLVMGIVTNLLKYYPI